MALTRLEKPSDGPGAVPKGRPVWSLVLAVAMLLGWVAMVPCVAQTQVSSRTAPPAPLPAAASPDGQSDPSALPSTIPADLQRFVTQSGVDRAVSNPSPDGASLSERLGLPPALPPLPSPVGPGQSVMPAPSPLATRPTMAPAPLAPTDLRFPINLATALRLSDARPLIVAAAQARTWVAEAELTRAKVIWVPMLNVAVDYLRHDGGGPDFNKGIMTAPSVNFFYAGAGLWGFLPMTDALYEPLVARRVLNARHWDIQTAKNDALMQTAEAYFRVHQYRGTYTGALYTVARSRDVLELIAAQSQDLAPRFEVDRARNMMADLEQQAASARQQWRVQSARLTRVLRLDPRAMVEPLEPDHLMITLIDPGRPLDELMAIGLTNRPELASRQALVEAAELAVRREKARPFIPNVVLSGYQSPGGMLIQGGIFGLGPNSSLNQWRGRDDVSVQVIWQLENFGIGNLARIKARRGMQSQSIVDLRRTQDMVAAEVTQARANLQSAAVRVVQADRALRTGIITLNGTIEGLKQTSRFEDVLVPITRPQEAVYALQLLQRAFDEYFTTVADYNRAQFELFRALGYPASEVARMRSPGPPLPVELRRPPYLPPVGNGPPPATR